MNSLTRHFTWILTACLPLACIFGPSQVFSKQGNPCDDAAYIAAKEFDVPFDILRAITRTETGRSSGGTLKPWPWAVNQSGKGQWFSSEADAKNHIRGYIEQGGRNIDVGCFQINHRWHAQEFASLDDMLDPVENARYAARFLADLYSEMGSWNNAVGAYHSRTPRYSQRYLARFRKIANALEPYQETVSFAEQPSPKKGLGSLVPIHHQTAKPFGLFSQNGLKR